MYRPEKKLLNSIFRCFGDVPACQHYSIATQGRTALLEFLGDNREDFWPAGDREWVACVLNSLGPFELHLPTYGCTLLQTKAYGCQSVAQIYLQVVYLDNWAFDIISKPEARSFCSQNGDPPPAPIQIGSVPKYLVTTFKERLFKKIDIAEKRTGDKRSAKNTGNRGHQKTPGFIISLARDCVELIEEEEEREEDNFSKSKPGFTDVGLHTGGVPRDTTWGLLKAVFYTRMVQAKPNHPRLTQLYQHMLAHFELWLTENELATMIPENTTRSRCDEIMQMMTSAAKKGAYLAELDEAVQEKEHFSVVKAFRKRCDDIRQRLAAVASERACLAAKKFVKDDLKPKEEAMEFRYPKVDLPGLSIDLPGAFSLEKVRAVASSNLGWRVLPPDKATISGLLSWARDCNRGDRPDDHAAQQLVLRGIEEWVFASGADLPQKAWGAAPNLPDLTIEGVTNLIALVETYRLKLAAFRSTTSSKAVMQSELRSRELLVAWTCFCLIHRAAATHHPLIKNYGVCLNWSDLQHLVLAHGNARNALLRVGQYLRAHDGLPIFSFRRLDQTNHLAEAFSQQDSSMMRRYDQETTARQARHTAYWKAVEEKRQLAAQLKRELRGLKEDLDGLRRKTGRIDRWEEPNAYRSAKRWEQSKELEVQKCQSRLNEAEKAPPPVFEPLPPSKSPALRVLFFLMLPSVLDALAGIGFSAQMLLTPRKLPAKLQRSLEGPTVKRDWASHYRLRSSTSSATSGKVAWGSNDVEPKNYKYGPSHIDDLSQSSPTKTGIWDPSCDTVLQWRGGNFVLDAKEACTNPFADLPPRAVVRDFTEVLLDSSLQWCMPQFGNATKATRENQALASRQHAPAWMRKVDFLSFASLRASPNLQLRKICIALREKTLPLDRPETHSLIQMAVFHVGTLAPSSDFAIVPLWKTDLLEGAMMPALLQELVLRLEEVAVSPQQHKSILILGELACHFSEYAIQHQKGSASQCHAISIQLAQVAMEQGLAVGRAIEQSQLKGLGHVRADRAKQCALYQYALLCHGAGPFDMKDAREMCKLIAISHHAFPLNEDGDAGEYEQHALALRVRCLDLLSNHLVRLISLVEQDPSMLTEAVRCVIMWLPNSLKWTQFQGLGNSSCFEAVFEAAGGETTHVSFNLLTGIVLLDGLPPSRLPTTILDHPLYQRNFGERNFEVTTSKATGVMKTIRPILGKNYEFNLFQAGTLHGGEGRLIVLESRGSEPQRQLLLLDGIDTSWAVELPPRLRSLFSHWYDCSANLILLRPIDYLDRSIQFLGVVNPLSPRWAPRTEAKAHPAKGPLKGRSKKAKKKIHKAKLKIGKANGKGEDDTFLWYAEHNSTEGRGDHADSIGVVFLRVPRHLWSTPLEVLLEQLEEMDRLLVDSEAKCTSPTLRVLSKFEGRQLVHVYGKNSGRICFHLPRYDLELELAQDGSLRSLDHSGMRLARKQQLDDSLWGFERYLVFEHMGCFAGSLSLLVPDGDVIRCHNKEDREGVDVHIQSSRTSNAYFFLQMHHRFGHLKAPGIEARLHLAALHAATASLLPEQGIRMTGFEYAMELVRQSFVNKPLTQSEQKKLWRLSTYGQWAPGLIMLCHELACSSSKLHMLHAGAQSPLRFPFDADAAAEYQMGNCRNIRQRLTAEEERRVLGVACRGSWPKQCPLGWREHKIEVCCVDHDVVEKEETELLALVIYPKCRSSRLGGTFSGPSFPLDVSTSSNIGHSMLQELQESWKIYHQAQRSKLRFSLDKIQALLISTQRRVEKLRGIVEEYIIRSLDASVHLNDESNEMQDAIGKGAQSYLMRRAANLVPLPTLFDLPRLLWLPDHELLSELNPFLCSESRKQVKKSISLWMQLCVLEDKMGRLCNPTCLASAEKLVAQLQVRRIWEASEHPRWLAFEVEGRIQIRPLQFQVAEYLLENPSSIVQLNMGEGKTRVILPMLVLFWVSRVKLLVRLHVLSQLLEEFFTFMHSNLTAGVLQIRLFVAPFCRDVDISKDALAEAMLSCFEHCQRVGGALIVAPEHRLSLHLKIHELRARSIQLPVAEELEVEEQQARENVSSAMANLQKIEGLPYADVFDESDEVLRHKYQLVYAFGAFLSLPGGSHRWRSAFGLLRIFKQEATIRQYLLCKPLQFLLEKSEAEEALVASSFSSLRFLSGPNLEETLPKLYELLFTSLCNNPPRQFRWMRDHPAENHKCMLTFVCDPLKTWTSSGMAGIPLGEEGHEQDLLSLRGFLAHGVLAHCMQLRHRVEFGIDTRQQTPQTLGSKRKRLAVPFIASDTPSERSEFAHIDAALLLTGTQCWRNQ